ncbi:PAS domain-containing protein [Sulfurimonas sp.]
MNKESAKDEEYIFKGSTIISQTDLSGKIVFANRKFCEVSGYSVDELINQPHNIIRHPDMPHVIFEKMWDTISAGHTWTGLVKNKRKDGLYYWVDTEILPIKNENDEVTGYIASRKAASRSNIEDAQAMYDKMTQEKE